MPDSLPQPTRSRPLERIVSLYLGRANVVTYTNHELIGATRQFVKDECHVNWPCAHGNWLAWLMRYLVHYIRKEDPTMNSCASSIAIADCMKQQSREIAICIIRFM